MAEVANLPSQAPPATSEHSAASLVSASAALPADIPNENLKNEVNDLSSAAQLGTSPNQEKSSNSHPHDSEYDTASDLEGGTHDDYEDDDDNDEEGEEEDDDDDDESVEEVGNSDTDSVEFDAERQRGDGQEQTDYTKKVDEDRSNPQYIPKKGTFYEHDDRTADEPEVQQSQVTEISEVGGENKSASPTTISQASKTMKKWQPASGVDRWSHDRFVAGEQAPKSRTELVSAYGYDIRDEDGPPRARRRRRYARGPSKYSRNWEDETAYIKASNAQRKPPRPEDFPALEERQKARKSRSYRDEKENRFDRPQTDRNRIAATGGGAQQIPNRDNKEPIRRSGGNPKHVRSGGRQHGMEFKNKNRSNGGSGHMNSNRGSNNIDRDGVNITRSIVNNQAVDPSSIVESSNFQKASTTPNNKAMNMQQTVKVINQQPYNGYEQQQGQAMHKSQQQQQQINNASASGYNPREVNEKFTNNHSTQSPRPVTAPSSNLSARLQQAQNRNDPSHVGSVQMHTLANQHGPQVPNQNNQNVMQNAIVEIQHQQQQQQQQQQLQQVVNQQEQARSKRYSSLRQRTQHEPAGAVPSNPHLDQHTLQQLQMQHEVQQQQQQHQQIASNVHPPQQLIMQEQQLLQANLMQLYHQENLQAQMQALQVSSLPPAAAPQPPAAAKQPYATIPQQYAAGSTGPPAAAYYTATTPDYSSPPPPAVPTQQLQYTQPPTAFLQSQSAAAPLAFNPTATQQPLSQNAMAPPIAASTPAQVPPGSVSYVQTAPPNPTAAPSTAYPNYTNYTPNFNTVGGTTYFVPTPQPTARPPVLPQRRPTNAIPILPPSEKKRTADTKQQEEDSKTNNSTSAVASANAPIGSAENIDHILDNMFVQRAPYQPQTRKSASPPSDDPNKGSNTNTSAAGAAAAAAGVADPSSVGKSRTHESSANASLLDNESSLASKQSSAVPDVNTQNMVVMGTVTNNSESGAGLGENHPMFGGAGESIGKQSAIVPPQ